MGGQVSEPHGGQDYFFPSLAQGGQNILEVKLGTFAFLIHHIWSSAASLANPLTTPILAVNNLALASYHPWVADGPILP